MPIDDLLHLVVIAAGLSIGVWALVALRTSMPRGRFGVFALASAGALFGCAALAGEVGVLPPAAWFVVVVVAMLGTAIAAQRIAAGRLTRT